MQADDNNLPPEQRRVKDYNPTTPWSGADNGNPKEDYVVPSEGNIDAVITPEKTTKAKKNDQSAVIEQDAVVFTQSVVNEAITKGASDIHFEPKRENYQIRFRVDGVLQKFDERPLVEFNKILNSVKVLGDMDIAEHSIPQDGHIEFVQERVPEKRNYRTGSDSDSRGHFFDIRVSIFPSVNGEVIVMRILNRQNALLTIQDLGMEKTSLDALHDALLTSYGMILVTGPTGSGKTTTLYSVLNELKDEEKNIITLEDPIEFHLEWLRQCEIRVDRNFTFEKAMESVLRQDPDVLMVGEIRDPHTAEHAVRSALVGRIVGSTIHANTTIGTIARLVEMGIPRSIIGHTLNAIIAQRLVRKNCTHCREKYTPNEAVLKHFHLENQEGPFYRGVGCEECGHTGYQGRIGVFSLMTFDDKLRNLLFDNRPLIEINEFAIQKGMRSLRQDASVKVLAGETTAEEASRVI
jgi:type IV pilus assembly protein PilB